jgi:hypothetical protein
MKPKSTNTPTRPSVVHSEPDRLAFDGRIEHHMHPDRRANGSEGSHRSHDSERGVESADSAGPGCRRRGSVRGTCGSSRRRSSAGGGSGGRSSRRARRWCMSSGSAKRGPRARSGGGSARRQRRQFDRGGSRRLGRQIDPNGFFLGLDFAGFLFGRNSTSRGIRKVLSHINKFFSILEPHPTGVKLLNKQTSKRGRNAQGG